MTSSWSIDPEELIPQVECRPLLYSKSVPEYTNKTMKFNAWKAVARNLSPEWDTLSKVERNIRCQHIQTKWKHLRDNFRREHLRSGAHSHTHGKRRKTYRYYDLMRFLIPDVKVPKPRGSGTGGPVFLDAQDTSDQSSEVVEDSLASTSAGGEKKTVFEEVVLKPGDRQNSESDEDRSFCLSLVQSFKRMDYDSKMLAKIEILKVIHNFSNTRKTL